mgnify:CR=1 FL=1
MMDYLLDPAVRNRLASPGYSYPGPTDTPDNRHWWINRDDIDAILTALAEAEERLAERDRLAAEVVALREALRRSRAVGSNHQAHWDTTGMAGKGCPECIERLRFNEETVNPLLTDPSSAVAEVTRLMAVGRACTGRHFSVTKQERPASRLEVSDD